MPLSDFVWASGEHVHAHETGLLYASSGQIFVERADPLGMDANLWGALKVGVDMLHLAIYVNSISTGCHAVFSRHYTGRAADINHIGRAAAGLFDPAKLPRATLDNPHAVAFARLLRGSGWRSAEGGPWPGLMLGPVWSPLNQTGVDHRTHLHVSIPNRPGVGSADGAAAAPEERGEPGEKEGGMRQPLEKEEPGTSIFKNRAPHPAARPSLLPRLAPAASRRLP